MRACDRLSRRRSITVSPARAMPVRTVTVASAVATGSMSVNCPTVSRARAAVAKTRMIVSTTGLNSGPGSGGGWWIQAAATRPSAAGSASHGPAASAATAASASSTDQPGRQRHSAKPPATPAAPTAASGLVPSATATPAVEEAPMAASSHDSRST